MKVERLFRINEPCESLEEALSQARAERIEADFSW